MYVSDIILRSVGPLGIYLSIYIYIYIYTYPPRRRVAPPAVAAAVAAAAAAATAAEQGADAKAPNLGVEGCTPEVDTEEIVRILSGIFQRILICCDFWRVAFRPEAPTRAPPRRRPGPRRRGTTAPPPRPASLRGPLRLPWRIVLYCVHYRAIC